MRLCFTVEKKVFNAPSCLAMCRVWHVVLPMHLDGLFCSEKVLKDLGVVEIIDKTRVSSKLRDKIELYF